MSIEKSEQHNVIILPGLGDHTKHIQQATAWWKKHDLHPHVIRMDWKDGSTDFGPKLEKVIELVDKLSKEGEVSIVGISAGGSAAFNAFLERPNTIQRAVNICGRLRAGQHQWRSLDRMSAASAAFKHSVLLFEGQESDIPDRLKSRMMTVSARLGDEQVPADTSHLESAHNIKIPSGGHMISIGLSLTLLAKPVIDFIKLGVPTWNRP